MMLLIAGVIAVFGWVSAKPRQRDPSRDRAALMALENDWLNGESDRATLDRILADDFVHPVPRGIFLTKQQHIDWSVQHPRPANRKSRFSRMDIRLYADVAIVNGIVEDSDVSGGETHRTVFTDVFALRKGRWQAVNAQENAAPAAP